SSACAVGLNSVGNSSVPRATPRSLFESVVIRLHPYYKRFLVPDLITLLLYIHTSMYVIWWHVKISNGIIDFFITPEFAMHADLLALRTTFGYNPRDFKFA